jgi:hypothetical protein
MRKKALYLQIIVSDVEPEIIGPFNSEEERLNAAIDHRQEDPDKEDGLFKLDITDGIPEIGTFSGGDLDE